MAVIKSGLILIASFCSCLIPFFGDASEVDYSFVSIQMPRPFPSEDQGPLLGVTRPNEINLD